MISLPIVIRRIPAFTAAIAVTLVSAFVPLGTFCLAAPQRAPAPIALTNFAHTGVLAAAGQKPDMEQGVLYRMELSPTLLLTTRLPGASDLCIFNAEGKRVPFAIRSQGWQDTSAQHELNNLYPLWGKPQSNSEELTVSFTIDKDARLIPKIAGAPLNQAPAGQELKGYVIPMPQEGISIFSLTFTWQKGVENTTRFALQTSSDLTRWHTLESRASLVRIDGPAGPLESGTLTLNGATAGKYLRILFEPEFAPQAISAIQVEQRSSVKQVRYFGPLVPVAVAEVAATKTTPYQPTGLEYTLPRAVPVAPEQKSNTLANPTNVAIVTNPENAGTLPVESLQLHSTDPGQYANVKVFTRASADQPWQQAGETAFFTALRNGQLLENKPLPLGGRSVGQIRLQALSKDAPLPERLNLGVTYTPTDLYFLAQGSGPYTLAWHSKRAVPTDEGGIIALLTQGGDIREATIGSIAKQTPAAEPQPAWFERKGTAQYALWAVLGCGVLLLGLMALRLVRGMQKE